VVLYLLLGLGSIPAFMRAPPGRVVDASGRTWNAHALYETMMTVNLFGAVLLALLALTRLAGGVSPDPDVATDRSHSNLPASSQPQLKPWSADSL